MQYGYTGQRDDSPRSGWIWMVRFHHATLKDTQFKTYCLFLGFFGLIFSDCGLLQVTETTENEMSNKGQLLYT